MPGTQELCQDIVNITVITIVSILKVAELCQSHLFWVWSPQHPVSS
jgi:hypothetical protein